MPTCLSTALLDRPMVFHALEAIFASYTTVVPLALALYRVAEAKHLRESQMIRPVLDLGCGSGEFGRLAVRDELDIGFDVSWRLCLNVRGIKVIVTCAWAMLAVCLLPLGSSRPCWPCPFSNIWSSRRRRWPRCVVS